MEIFLEPIRERYHELISRPDDVRDVLRQGAKKASAVAQETLREVYDLVGFRY